MDLVDNLMEGLNNRYEAVKQELEVYDLGTIEYIKAEEKMKDILNQMQQFYKTSNEAYAKEEERKNQIQIEEMKQKVTWQKAALEIGKILIPAGISTVTFFVGQKRMIQFEETGRFTSGVSREIHLPRIFK